MVLAIKYCIEHGVLKQFFEENGSEVVNMLLEEWSLDDALVVEREEGREEGILAIARKALEEGIPVEQIQKITGLSCEIIEQL